MQDQGKRLILAVGLALAFMLVWQHFTAKPVEPPKPQTAGSNVAPAPAKEPVSQAPIKKGPVAQRGGEQTIVLKFPKVTATFSSYGGILKSWQLSDPRYERDATHGELLPKYPDTGAFAVDFLNSTYELPNKAEWTGQKVSDTEVRYTISTPQVDVEKTFDVVPQSFIVKMTVKVTAKASGQETLAVTVFGYQNPNDSGGGGRSVQPRIWQSTTLRDGTLVTTPYKALKEAPRYEQNIQWTGFEHPYILTGYAPRPLSETGTGVWKETFAEAIPGLMRTDLVYPVANMKPGETMSREVVGYLGPKNYKLLEGADDVAGFSTGFKKTIDFGWFDFIGKPLLWLLLKFYAAFGNWGIAIVILTFLVKGATLFWTTKSMRSMKTMAILAPQMKALQEKYKNDKQRLQIETMALYKQYGANPLSGCLPIVLQMPIWFALYRMLANAGELYLQPFIHGWIDDLTGPDPTYILPIILVITMFVQARLTPQSGDPSQCTQQKIMQYGMPIGFGAMSFFFPAGLTLYIFTNTCLSALHSIYMNKYDKKSLALAAQLKQAQEAKASAANANAAKAAKDANPKSDDADADEAPASERNPRALPQRQKRSNKKGRRR